MEITVRYYHMKISSMSVELFNYLYRASWIGLIANGNELQEVIMLITTVQCFKKYFANKELTVVKAKDLGSYLAQ